MKASQYTAIAEFADAHSVLEENILTYYRFWNERLDMHDVDLSYYMQICCLLKCCTQKEDDDILNSVHHMYKILCYESLVPVIVLFSNIRMHKELGGDKTQKEIYDEMFALYRESFGMRHVWAISMLVDELSRFSDYQVNIGREKGVIH